MPAEDDELAELEDDEEDACEAADDDCEDEPEELDGEELDELCAPGVAMMKMPMPRMTNTATAASATYLLFKRFAQSSSTI